MGIGAETIRGRGDQRASETMNDLTKKELRKGDKVKSRFGFTFTIQRIHKDAEGRTWIVVASEISGTEEHYTEEQFMARFGDRRA